MPMSDPADAQLAGLIDGWLGPGAAEETRGPGLRAAVEAIERAWDLVIPHRLLDQTRDRTELVETIVTHVRRHLRLRARRRPVPRAARVQVRIEPPESRGIPGLSRSGALTAYDVEEILDGARRWGPGTRIEVAMTDTRDAAMVEALRERAAALGEGVVTVTARRLAPDGG